MDDKQDPHAGLEDTVAHDDIDFVGTGFKGKEQAYEKRGQGPAGDAQDRLADDGQTKRYNDASDRNGDFRTLGPREAAMAIAPSLQADASSRMDPESAHGLRFVKEVCSHLGLEPTTENVEHVRLTLREHKIKLHAGNEYPKWVGEGTDRVIVNSAEEEDKFNSDKEALIADKHDEVQHTEANRTADILDAPPYEPFAGPREPGAPNRPTEPAPVASPVSDNRGDITQRSQFPATDANPNPTPNPQPGDRVNTGPSTFESDSRVPGKSSGQADNRVGRPAAPPPRRPQ